MDLNDSFTETLLQKSKARKEFLDAKMNEPSSITRRKRTVLADENAPENSPKRRCFNYAVESEKENDHVGPINVQDTFVPFKVSTNVRGLAAVQKKDANDMKDSTDNTLENKWEAHITSSSNSSQAPMTHQTRLANLAAQINQWEDNCHQPTQASNISSLPKKTNLSSVCKIPTSNSNSIAIKLYYTNKPAVSHNFGMQTVSQVNKNGLFDSTLGSSSMPFDLKTSNDYTNLESVTSTKAGLQDRAFKVSMLSEENGKFKAKPLTISNREEIKKCNFEKNAAEKDNMFTKMNYSSSAKQSNTSSKSNNGAVHTHFPLSTRKAFFEKAATNPRAKTSEPAFRPKLSVVQRAAMFENSSKGNNKQPQINLSLPKRIVSPLVSKNSEVGEQQIQHGHCDKILNKFDAHASDSPIQGGTSTTVSERKILSKSENNDMTSCIDHPLMEISVCSPKQIMKADVINLPKEIEKKTHIIVDNSSNSLQKLESAISGKGEKCVADEIFNVEQKSVKNALKQNCVESIILQKQCNESNIENYQQEQVKICTANSQEMVAASEVVQRKDISNLLNHWEKISSTTVEPNPENEYSSKQLENISMNSSVSDGEQSDCKSELEWESTEGESTSEWEYIKGESMTKLSDRKSIPEFNELESENNAEESCLEINRESISEYKNKEITNGLSVADNKEKMMEGDAINLKAVSAESGFETSNFPVSTDDIDNHNEQNWKQEVQNNTNQNSSNLLESSSDCKIPQISQCQTVLNQGLIEPSKVKEFSDKQEMPIDGGRSRSIDSPLVHTVSFYRKQKQESKRSFPMTPLKRPLSSDEEDDPTLGIQKRIKLLQEEILRQQTVIGQTSQALNLCYATTEFLGSTEKIEAERLLLIANQKRLACMNEIQSLKFRGIKKGHVTDGTLIIRDLQLPLKQDFIASQLKGTINNVHCFLCLIRHGAEVIVSQVVSTGDKIPNGALCFSNHAKLQNLSSDFSVVFEVYTLQTSKENLSHDEKYHIKRDHSKIRLTPKGKKAESKLLRPAISSPGGPDAVRSSNFALIGYTRFTVQNYNKKCFTLDKIPFTSPLEGTLKATLELQTNHTTSHKGFLTLFQDVNSFGLWTRLWCSLDSRSLSCWKYPDDEQQRKDPVGGIDLKECATGVVGPAPRDECARANTFRMVTVRPIRDGDKETLVSRSEGTLTRTRHLLSADTKEERMVWCNKLNEALANVRKWDTQARLTVEGKYK